MHVPAELIFEPSFTISTSLQAVSFSACVCGTRLREASPPLSRPANRRGPWRCKRSLGAGLNPRSAQFFPSSPVAQKGSRAKLRDGPSGDHGGRAGALQGRQQQPAVVRGHVSGPHLQARPCSGVGEVHLAPIS